MDTVNTRNIVGEELPCTYLESYVPIRCYIAVIKDMHTQSESIICHVTESRQYSGILPLGSVKNTMFVNIQLRMLQSLISLLS